MMPIMLLLFGVVFSEMVKDLGTSHYSEDKKWSELKEVEKAGITIKKYEYINLSLPQHPNCNWILNSVRDSDKVAIISYGYDYNADGTTSRSSFAFLVVGDIGTTIVFKAAEGSYVKTYELKVDIIA
eukprot:TRINITY_DN9271_c0_g1_i1.p1 TRINITY_DN9271_c0_g1~~TRINITY_DN9271_c0_g1_i1.p1  ORF type:complete len:127 (+),score=7.36 TRINITY_DN9271_c0_g1_i1:174-554(+)